MTIRSLPKGLTPILIGLFGFVIGVAGASAFWPQYWTVPTFPESLGFLGGIIGGLMTLIAAMIAFRPARDQMLIARAASIATDLRDLRDLKTAIATLITVIEEHMIIVEDSFAYPFDINYLSGVHDGVLSNRIQLIYRSTVEINKCRFIMQCARLNFGDADQIQKYVYGASSAVSLFIRLNRGINNIADRGGYDQFVIKIKEQLPDVLTHIETAARACSDVTAMYAQRARDLELQLGPH